MRWRDLAIGRGRGLMEVGQSCFLTQNLNDDSQVPTSHLRY